MDLDSGWWKDNLNVFADVANLDAEFSFCWRCKININLVLSVLKKKSVSRESRNIWYKFIVCTVSNGMSKLSECIYNRIMLSELIFSSWVLTLEYWAFMENGEQRDVCWNDECQQGKAGTMEIKKRSSEVMGRRWGQDRACSSLRSILRLQGN